jgi:hypothetical protein
MSDSSRSLDREELPKASDRARKLVANHETVAMEYRHWGATELGDAENAVLEYIARLESENERLKETALTPSEAAAIVEDWDGAGFCLMLSDAEKNTFRSAISKVRRSATSEETS